MTVRAVGADAYAKGWVAVRVVDGRVDRVWVDGRVDRVWVDRVWAAPTLAVLMADEPEATTVGVDMPLGGVVDGWRTADREAKRLLGARHATVFSVPPRPLWDAADYSTANAGCREITGTGLSVQAFGLVRKMLEAETYRDAGRHELHEVHPELVFSALAGGPLAYGKKTWNGQMTRRSLLAGVGVVLPDDIGAAAAVPCNDVLDAAAVAWCAYRIARGAGAALIASGDGAALIASGDGAALIASGDATHVPDPPDQYDHRGRPIVIWF